MKCLAISVMVVLVLGLMEATEAVGCNPLQLTPCANAISSSTTPPTAECCSRLKEQKNCLCGYLKDPKLRRFVASPNAKKVAIACGSPFPNC
nr:non-specific lipid-transfer protein 2-like [Ipomoea batatas]